MSVFPREIGSAVNENECIALALHAQDQLCLEIGSFLGRSSVVIAGVAKELHCVDWHRGEAADLKDKGPIDSLVGWRDNMMRYGLLDKTVLHMGRSDQVLPFLRGYFGFCFIDGDHNYEAVRDDIKNVRPLMLDGAPIMLHDYTWEELGVQRAVDEAFQDVKVIGSSALVRA